MLRDVLSQAAGLVIASAALRAGANLRGRAQVALPLF